MRTIHFVGVGGVGMAALAALRQKRGDAVVSGCDLKPTPRTRWLESLGVRVRFGHDPAHVEGVDEVIATPAVSRENPECVAAAGRLRSRGEALAETVNAAADSIVVCGSHGKTTTSTYIARLLIALGENVAWAIGGETGDFPVGGSVRGDDPNRGEVLVVEGDESDGTLALYRAKTLVVTNVEYDHPDHFKTPADYRACFDTARRNAERVFEGADVADPNAELAVRVALSRGHSRERIDDAMKSVTAVLPDRRYQRLADGVYADYAHHPTEIRYTLRRARAECRGRLRALFQPHRYSRTKALKADFATALALADEVVLCPTYSAFEPPVEGGDVADLYLELRNRGIDVKLARSCEEAWEHASNVRADGDLTLVLGAGDIINRLHAGAPRKLWIGAGSNTWKSDLRLSVAYERTQGPADAPGATLRIAWMAGVPGTIGGWTKMNAGAFGHSVSELIEAVCVDGRWIAAEDCGFGYRTSGIAGEISDVRFDASKLAAAQAESAADYLAKRPQFPAGTFGSFFRNPEGDFAGRLLEAAGAKSLRVGGARVWERHANVIVRGEGCTPSDVLALARLMAEAVYFRFGVRLEPEVAGIVL